MPKPRRRTDLRRRGPQREPYDRILIVCEDTRSARGYFEEIRREWHLSPVNIVVRPSDDGTDPRSVVCYAHDLFSEENNDYDVVYCVFDRDQHETFGQALDLIKKWNLSFQSALVDADGSPRSRFRPIVSDPCFEFWLLLHYRYTDRPYGPTGSRSPCEDLIHDLKEYIKDYDKGSGGVFARTAEYLPVALEHARRRARRADADGTTNPRTDIHLLIQHLDDLRLRTSHP